MFNQKLWMFKSWSTCILIILLLWFTIFCWFLYESISDSWVSRYGGFYSHEDVREVVQYAQQRGITVIPEIDIPGHCFAAIQALPELSESVQKEGAPRSVKAGTCLLREDFVFVFLVQDLVQIDVPCICSFQAISWTKTTRKKHGKKWKKQIFFPKEREFLTETQRFPWQRAERPSRGDVSFPRGGAHRGLGALPGTLRARRHGWNSSKSLDARSARRGEKLVFLKNWRNVFHHRFFKISCVFFKIYFF